MRHTPVLLKEVIEGLALKEGDTVVDCTVGHGGHAKEICSHIGKTGTFIGIDLDENAVFGATEELKKSSCVHIIVEGNFRSLINVLAKLKISRVNAIVFDLGLRTDQLSASGRGFSFRSDEPLIMTFSAKLKSGGRTAYEIVNSWPKEEIEIILKEFGEERFSRRIAEGIVEARRKRAIQTTGELVAIIQESTPAFYQRGRGHAARKTFQALRVAVNDELDALREGLVGASRMLAVHGRIAVITFHSLEDRIVKSFFKKKSEEKVFKIITRKPISPQEEEIAQNPLSRSAKLRIIEKIST